MREPDADADAKTAISDVNAEADQDADENSNAEAAVQDGDAQPDADAEGDSHADALEDSYANRRDGLRRPLELELLEMDLVLRLKSTRQAVRSCTDVCSAPRTARIDP